METKNISLSEPTWMLEADDRASVLTAFDQSKAGVKTLADAGIKKIPSIFLHPHRKLEKREESGNGEPRFCIPVIDLDGALSGLYSGQRCGIVDKVRDASENWGAFQIVNHGIPADVMNEVMTAVRKFHDQDIEVKKGFYSRDREKRFMFHSNFDLYEARATSWLDTIECILAPHQPNSQDIPLLCRGAILEYAKHAMDLGLKLFELLSEGLGLERNHLKDMYCAEGLRLLGHYYPLCPEPDLTLGSAEHTDSQFLTLLLQDQISGLQVFHKNHWVDVPFVPGSLVVNIGDFLQLLSNDKFKAAYHRVVVNKVSARTSVACFFGTHYLEEVNPRLFGPIQQLLSAEHPPLYPEITVQEFMQKVHHEAHGKTNPLSLFRFKY